MKKPITVYYLHYYDEDHKNPAFSKYKDFVTCVMAEDTNEAIEKTKIIAGNQNIKIMGIASGREEDVNEKHPLGTHEEIMPLGGWKNKNKNNMTELETWQLVNQAETQDQLADVIAKLTDSEGMIQGRVKKHNASQMIIGLNLYMKDQIASNILTREFGIRQQAIYLKHFID